MSMSESIRKYAAKHPGATANEIAKALGMKSTYVYKVLWNVKKLKKAPIVKDTVTDTSDTFMKAMAFAAGVGRAQAETPHDPVNQPAHYTAGGIETIDFIDAKKLNYNLGNVVKYITRAEHKGNKLEDLRKAQWYLTREINLIK